MDESSISDYLSQFGTWVSGAEDSISGVFSSTATTIEVILGLVLAILIAALLVEFFAPRLFGA